MFHDHFLQAILPLIYGAEWSVVSERVLRDFGIQRLRPEVLVQTPRRFGKTTSIAMFCAAVLLNIPDIRICIFSTGKRASGSLMAEIVSMLTKAGHKDRIVKRNQEQVRAASARAPIRSIPLCLYIYALILVCVCVRQLFISQTARAEGVGINSEKAKSTCENAGISKLFSFPAGTAGRVYHTHTHTHARVSF